MQIDSLSKFVQALLKSFAAISREPYSNLIGGPSRQRTRKISIIKLIHKQSPINATVLLLFIYHHHIPTDFLLYKIESISDDSLKITITYEIDNGKWVPF